MHDVDAQITIFKALAHPVRLQIMALLRYGEVCVCHMESALDKRQAYISQQLMILREAGLIDSRKDGRQVFYWITDDRTRAVLDAALGESPTGDLPQIAGCPCPMCSTVPLDTIAVRQRQA
jgi:DNA-binding transcriptional ArsR family regulator